MATERLTDQHRRVLCEMIRECWHEPNEEKCCKHCGTELYEEEYNYKWFTVEKILLNDYNRTFKTGNDMMLVKEALVKQGEWDVFCSYAAYYIAEETGLHGKDIIPATLIRFTAWLLEPERFNWLAAEWLLNRKENENVD